MGWSKPASAALIGGNTGIPAEVYWSSRVGKGSAFQQYGAFKALGSILGESPELDVVPPVSLNCS